MNIPLILIGLSILAFFILPVIYIHRVQKKTGKEFHKRFISLASKNQISITDNDLWSNNTCIGIDKSLGVVFYLKRTDDKDETVQIDLKEISQCRLVQSNMKGKSNNANNAFERIDVAFTFKNGGTESYINFYNSNDIISHSEGHDLAIKWTTIVNDYLKSI